MEIPYASTYDPGLWPANATDQLSVELVAPIETPPTVVVRWPASPTSVASSDNFSELVAGVFRVLAEARTTLSRMRGDRRTR
jgi:hypothetical protein